jgi:alpha-tubulin suppressor-like RCC1 family protein
MHSSFISMNGDLYMCGSNDYGELGSNRKEKLSVPTLVHTKSRLVEASCGIFYTLLLDEHGRLYAMGNNKYGQLGTGSKNPEFSPILIKSLENEYIVKVESGYHSGALNDKGDLFLWGSGTFGEYLRPTKVKKPYPFIDLSIGGFFGAAIDNKHNVYSWGNNNSG